MLKRELVEEIAEDAGFDLVGFGPAGPNPDARQRFDAWLEDGRHADMGWLERNRDRILDAERYVPGVRGALALGVEYPSEPCEVEGGARVARYAAGRDYHRALGKRLERLRERLQSEGLRTPTRYGVDAVPILERALSVQAGIGFLAKSSGVINPERGPYLLLAEILHGRDFDASAPARGSCGTCTACIDACPTDAIVAPFEVDARRCISYTTIEKRGIVPREMRAAHGSWLFGCDVCLEVCPFTSRSRARSGNHADFTRHRALEAYSLVGILELSREDWDRDWTGTAMRRAKLEGLRRNAAIVLGNMRASESADALASCLDDEDLGLRSAAAWALVRMDAHRGAVAAAHDRERDDSLRQDIEATLDEAGL